MSYILDALKKSEQERGQGNVPGVQTVHSSSLNYHLEKRPLWPWLLAALFIINLVVVFYFLQSKDSNIPVVNIRTETINESSTPVTTTTTAINTASAFRSPPVSQNREPVIEKQVLQQEEPIESVFETVELYDLPLSVRQNIPEMIFSAHVYSSNPLQRSLVINGRFMEEGSQVNNSLTLVEITSDGAVFDFEGYRFNTSVLSGWD